MFLKLPCPCSASRLTPDSLSYRSSRSTFLATLTFGCPDFQAHTVILNMHQATFPYKLGRFYKCCGVGVKTSFNMVLFLPSYLLHSSCVIAISLYKLRVGFKSAALFTWNFSSICF